MHIIRTGVLGVNTLIVPIKDNKVFVVDPAACSLSYDENKITDYLKNKKLTCQAVVLTHSHFDHIMGLAPIKKSFPDCKIYLHSLELPELSPCPGPMNRSVVAFFGAMDLLGELSKQPPADCAMNDGDLLFDSWKVIHTPGHTPGSICLYNSETSELISGDTLFDGGFYGRTDMYGGDDDLIIKSVAKLKKLIPPGTKVYPGHDSYGFVL